MNWLNNNNDLYPQNLEIPVPVDGGVASKLHDELQDIQVNIITASVTSYWLSSSWFLQYGRRAHEWAVIVD